MKIENDINYFMDTPLMCQCGGKLLWCHTKEVPMWAGDFIIQCYDCGRKWLATTTSVYISAEIKGA